MNKTSMYNDMSNTALEYVLSNMIGFTIKVDRATELELSSEHIKDDNIVLNIFNWSLEQTTLSDTKLHTVVVFNEEEYWIDIELIDILFIATKDELILARSYELEQEPLTVKELLLNDKALKHEQNNADGIKYSLSKLMRNKK